MNGRKRRTLPLLMALALGCCLSGAALASQLDPPSAPDVPSPAPAVTEVPASTATADLARRVRALEEELRRLHAPPGTPRPSGDPQTETFEARWRNAFVIQSPDERFRLRLGGLVQADGRYFVGRPDPPPSDALNQFLLRRARIDVEADAWRYFSVRIQPDFAGGKIVLFDAYADVKIFPELRLRAGKFKVPFGLERLQPASSLVFAERAAPTEIGPNRDLGAQVSGDIAGASLSYAVGVFNGNVDNSTIDAELDDDKEVAARLFVQPFRRLRVPSLHGLGIGGAFTYGVRSGTAQSPNVLAVHSFAQSQIFSFLTGTTAADTVTAAGPRLRWTVQGCYYFWRLGLLGEYVSTTYNVQKGATTGEVGFSAWQAEATFLLTSDQASYTGVVPRRPFDPWHRGWGALELAAGYSGLQIDPGAFDGGFADPKKSVRAAQTFTVGASWYMTANTRVLFDYSHTDFTGGATAGDRADEDVLVGRVQFSL